MEIKELKALKALTCEERYQYFKELKRKLPRSVTLSKIARKSNTSYGLVTQVFAGLSTNEAIMNAIIFFVNQEEKVVA
jgi:hypothetical protein